ncbi:DUF3048 domain-containing protein [Saccharopolyspora hordei]|uniref:DUF3048 domain-containing protein n=1 Tax=Saccharopolyspora hordei TaxID=1838 RepID=A0A853ATK0_9PSEU|nr:DUF3048 domain-containing protein [Saccharopolyspora hordei]NYI85980.1 hypothetical protein [Saccharopolyspora hordei]
MWWVRVLGTLTAVAAVLLGGLALQPSGTRTLPVAAPPPPPPPEPPPAPPPAGPPVLAVKVDNAPAARPPTGIGTADVVFVEPVEAGITRLIAVFGTRQPPVVGPVRSARQTDLRLLPQFGRPALAFSGAAPELLPEIDRAPVVGASQASVPGAFYRGPGKAPHNLYVRPSRLPAGEGWSPNAALTFGPAPGGGVPTSGEQVAYRAAEVGFTWSPEQQRWLVSMDGRPYAATDSGRLAASTVVLQEVPVTSSRFQDVAGNVSPFAETVGTGRAVVLRDGQSFEGRWDRPAPELGTRYLDPAGEPIPFAPGQVWVVLVPAP